MVNPWQFVEGMTTRESNIECWKKMKRFILTMKFLDVQSLFVVIECFLKGILSNWSLFFFISVFFSPSHVFFFCRIERFLIYQSISLVGFHFLGLSIEFSVHFVSIQRSTVIIIIHFFDIAEWSLHKDHKSNAIHWRRAKSKESRCDAGKWRLKISFQIIDKQLRNPRKMWFDSSFTSKSTASTV